MNQLVVTLSSRSETILVNVLRTTGPITRAQLGLPALVTMRKLVAHGLLTEKTLETGWKGKPPIGYTLTEQGEAVARSVAEKKNISITEDSRAQRQQTLEAELRNGAACKKAAYIKRHDSGALARKARQEREAVRGLIIKLEAALGPMTDEEKNKVRESAKTRLTGTRP